MDADDASIKRQLLTVQNDLIDAYEKGPEELVSFMKSWNVLKDRIITGASAHLLSIETLQLAAEVAKPVAAIASSLLNLNAVGTKLSAELTEETTRQVILHHQSLDDSQLSEDEDSDSPPNSEYLSDSECDDDEWEDPDAPKYYILRDWFFANIGHPFLDPAQDYEELVKEANVDRDDFLKWLEFVRTRSGWHRIFDKHAHSSPHWMEKLCEQVFNELDLEVPRRKSAVPLIIRDDFRSFRLQVDQIYHPNLSEWWGDVNQLLAQAGYERWSDPVDDLDGHSDDYVSSNEEIDDSDSDSESDRFMSPSIVATPSTDAEPHAPIGLAISILPISVNVVGTKRKAVELAVDLPHLVSATREQDSPYQSCKRRKLEDVGTPDREPTPPLPSRFSISSASRAADPQSSRASSSPSPSDCSASDLHTSDVHTDQSDPSVPGPQLLSQSVVRIPDTLCKTGASNLGPSSSPLLPEPSSLPHQVQDDTALQAQYIRSSHVSSISKRKREADPEDCVTSARESSSINQPIPGLPHNITTFNTHTNRIYNRIHIIDGKELPNRLTSRDMGSRPRKRLRENQLRPSSAQPSESCTLDPVSQVHLGRSPMDPSSHAQSSDTPQAERHYVDLTTAHSIKDKDVVQPLASAPLEQEATSLTTESIDIASWLSSGIESSTTEQGPAEPHLLVGYDSSNADRDPSPASWSQLYGPEPHAGGGDNYDSPYDPSTPGWNPLSPGDTASISSGDAATPCSIADLDYDPLPREIQAKSPSGYLIPESVPMSSSLDWEQSPWTPG